MSHKWDHRRFAQRQFMKWRGIRRSASGIVLIGPLIMLVNHIRKMDFSVCKDTIKRGGKVSISINCGKGE